jgi:NAD(P)-dependent dehydrogenase (short-subunit alcohol dehydrogenase family)
MLLDGHDRVDLLVNNAGVMSGTLERTAEGFESDIGVNHLGHFALTVMLARALAAAAPARVVNVGSRAHRSSDILWQDPHFRTHPFDKWTAYGQSKTANSLFTVELDRLLAPRGVRAYAVFPGMVGTRLFRDLEEGDWELLRSRVPSGRIEALPVEVGAATIVWAATAAELDGIGGVYLENCHISGELRAPDDAEGYMPYSMDPAAARRLWEWSERETGERLALD